MTTSSTRPRPTTSPTSTAIIAPLWTRALAFRLVGMTGSSLSFYVLLSAVPLASARDGGGGTAVAGLATGCLLWAAVAGEGATPWILRRVGYRTTQVAGLVLMGAPALALPLAGTHAVLVVCVLRGLGFALVTVAGGALSASLLPPSRRGEGFAILGLCATVPAVGALSGGVWLTEHGGYPTACAVAAVAALGAIPSVYGVPTAEPDPEGDERLGTVLARPGVRRLALLFASVTAAAGALLTFLPLALAGAASVAAPALVLHNAAAAVGRLGAGRHGDRRGSGALLRPGAVALVLGLGLVATLQPVAALVGATVAGLGFGVLQNATLCGMYASVSEGSYGAVSALWNLAYDAGMGLGAAAFGAVAGWTGYRDAFVLVAVPVVVTAVRQGTTRRVSAPGAEGSEVGDRQACAA